MLLASAAVVSSVRDGAALEGFITSAMLWGGDEPFTDIPVAQSSNIMISMGRDYWDAGLGYL